MRLGWLQPDDKASESIPLQNGAKHHTSSERVKLWTPRSLSLPYLIAFIILLSALAVAPGALFAVSENQQGIATSTDDLHYLWTYGPTAVFTIVSALWAPVDFRVRQLMPWKNMQKPPTPSQNSLFLDYLSPWIGSLLWSSLKNGHTAVLLVLVGRLLTQLLVVLSTGLLILQPVNVQDNHLPLTVTDTFRGDGFNNAAVDIRQYQNVYDAQRFGVSYPRGTTSQIAFQSFNASHPVNGTITSLVDAFHMDVSCKVVVDNVRVPGPSNVNAFNGNWTDTVGSTEITMFDYYEKVQISNPELCLRYQPGAIMNYNFLLARPPPFCSGRTKAPGEILLEVMVPQDPTSEFMMTSYANITAVHCSTGYGISPLNVTIDAETGALVNTTIRLAGQHNRTLPGVSADNVLEKVLELVRLAPVTRPNADYLTTLMGNGLFLAMSNANPDVNGTGWLDGNLLATQAEKTMSAMAAQLAKDFLLVPAHGERMGTSEQTLNRILVRVLSLGLMEAALCVLICVVAAFLVFVPWSVCPRDPTSIGAMATILASSGTVNRSLQGTGTWSEHTLASAGVSRTYESHVALEEQDGPQFSIKTSDEQPLCSEDGRQKVQWWIPISSKVYAQLTILGMPVVLIVVLEILYQYSQQHAGVIDVQSESYTYYAWVYVPAMTLFGISTLYGMVDENARIFQPYSVLRKSPAPARVLISSQHLGKPTLRSLWDSIRFRHLATLATALAVLIGGMLPVAVSGLFTMQMMVKSEPIQGTQVQQFWLNPFDTSGVVTPSMILYNNLTYPPWTYETLAYPTIQFSEDIMGSTGTDDRITMDIPAARSRINCTALAQDSVVLIHYNATSVKVNVTLPASVALQPGDPSYDEFGNWNYIFYPFGYFGNLFMMDHEIWNVQSNGPGYVAVYGYADAAGTNSTVSAWMCSPFFETVNTTTTFKTPNFQVDPTNPPIVDERTARPSPISTLTAYDVNWDLVTSMISYISIGQTPTGMSFDEIFEAMVWATGGVPAHQLLNNTELLTQLQRVYGIVEAQRLRAVQLEKWNTTAAPEPVRNATLHRSNQARLVQNGISTRILEAFLASMLVCGIVASFAVVTRRTLPKDPCSIGAQVSLLAGSRLASREILPVGSEWSDDEMLKRQLDGMVFRMGWWNESERFGIDVDSGGVCESDDGSDRGIKRKGKGLWLWKQGELTEREMLRGSSDGEHT